MSAGTRGKVTTAPSEVVVLTPSNFDKIVLDRTKDVLVEFYAPWYDDCLNSVTLHSTALRLLSLYSELVVPFMTITTHRCSSDLLQSTVRCDWDY